MSAWPALPRPRLSSNRLPVCCRHFTRPTFAPKPVLDIKHIRQNPGLYEQNCISRNYGPQAKYSWRILDLHEQRVKLQASSQSLRSKNSDVRRQLANAASSPDGSSRAGLLAQAKEYKLELDAITKQDSALENEIETLALQLPALSSTHSPDGDSPKLLSYINSHPDPSSTRQWRSHVDIGTALNILDFTGSSTTSGWGWYFLLSHAVTLESALVQYALSLARQRSFVPVSPPSIVYSHIASACGFQPRDQNGETQIYALANSSPPLVLAGTAEIPLAGMHAGATLQASSLPRRYVGASRCYRAEAGARGVDTKGLYRVHEFTKVEMFAWAPPDSSEAHDAHFSVAGASVADALFDDMLALQTQVISGLGLHARVLEMPGSDLGASAERKIDIEAWFPSRRDRDGGWGEVSSLSLCGDYQARRLGTRMKRPDGKLDWPVTLNGTALAVPRVLAAVLENGWDEERQVVKLPEVLWPWMGGVTEIAKEG